MYGFRSVWFPDGIIRWYAEGTPGLLPYLTPPEIDDNIRPTMAYMAERLPLNIQEVATPGESNLMFKKSVWTGPMNLAPNSQAWAYGYWDPGGQPKDISYFNSNAVNPFTTAHEFGHALGMPHEHQRLDRIDLQVSAAIRCSEPGNYGQAFFNTDVRYHSPFDRFSRMMYRDFCVRDVSNPALPQPFPQPRYRGVALYSRDDINSIYRVYGRSLSLAGAGDQFGHALAVFDLDDDGFEDLVIAANVGRTPNLRRLMLFFFRGVRTDSSELGAGRRYMPWFVHRVGGDLPNTPATQNYRLALAVGDFDNNGRMELAVGYNVSDNERRVAIFGQELPRAFSPSSGIGAEPWGVKGLRLLQEIAPADVAPGYDGQVSFAQALAVGRLTSTDRDDLLIGWPDAHRGVNLPGGVSGRAGRSGAVVHLRGIDTGGPLDTATTAIITNPGSYNASEDARFGSAIAVLRRTLDGLDTIAVGAPGERPGLGGPGLNVEPTGGVYIFGRSRGSGGRPRVPPILAVLNGLPHSRFGHALASISVVAGGPSLVIGAPDEREVVNGQAVPFGAIYHFGIDYLAGGATTRLGRLPAPEALRDADMQWGHALAVVQEGDDFDSVQVGLGAPGAGPLVRVARPGTWNRGLAYAWKPFTPAGGFSTAGEILPMPASTVRFGETLHAIAFASAGIERRGFAIGSPAGLIGREDIGFVRVLINENALAAQGWQTDAQQIDCLTVGDHPPDN